MHSKGLEVSSGPTTKNSTESLSELLRAFRDKLTLTS
jgi:hypothetical protein